MKTVDEEPRWFSLVSDRLKRAAVRFAQIAGEGHDPCERRVTSVYQGVEALPSFAHSEPVPRSGALAMPIAGCRIVRLRQSVRLVVAAMLGFRIHAGVAMHGAVVRSP